MQGKVEIVIKKIASHHNKTSAQILLRWCVEKKIPAVVKSANPKHQKENLDIFDFSLTQEEMHTLDHMPKVMRLCHPLWDDYDY